MQNLATDNGEFKAKTKRYSKWIRLYADILTDYRIGSLTPHTAWGWVRILLVADMHPEGTLPPISGIAFHLRMSISDAAALVHDLIEFRLLDVIVPGNEPVLRPHNWRARQFRWDAGNVTAKERSKRYRKRKHERDASVTRQSRKRDATVFPSESVSVSVSSVSLPSYPGKAYQEEVGSRLDSSGVDGVACPVGGDA